MVLLGDDAAKTICERLPKEQLRLLAEEITELGGISPEMAATVLQEYKGRTVKKEMVGQGGPDFATQLLVKTFGDEGSRPLVDQVVRSQEITAKNFEALEKADPEQLVKLLQQEHPQTVALVLAHLNSERGSRGPLANAGRFADASRAASSRNAEFFSRDGEENLHRAAEQARHVRTSRIAVPTSASRRWPICSTAWELRSRATSWPRLKRTTPTLPPQSGTRCLHSRTSWRFRKPVCANC